MPDSLAPVVLFVYNRLWHAKQTIESLKKNELASESELFIFSDGPKDEREKRNVQKVREYIKTIDGFKNVEVIERDKNWGLADNIIDGVTKVINKYGKIIVLEDDLVTAPYFLKFMNDTLNFYKEKRDVWHISAWNYPVKIISEYDTFYWGFMNCWGWGTWKDRWEMMIFDVDKLMLLFDYKLAYKFSIGGLMSSWYNLIANKIGIKKTWAVYWNATIFLNDGLCVNPVKSLVKNIGCGREGSNCRKILPFLNENIEMENNKDFFVFDPVIERNKKAIRLIKSFLIKRGGMRFFIKQKVKFCVAVILHFFIKFFIRLTNYISKLKKEK